MYLEDKFREDYFKWLCNIVCGKRFGREVSYNKLLSFLYSKEFYAVMPRDENRASDGIDLRKEFMFANGYDTSMSDLVSEPCNILEMMVALSLRCERTIMDNPQIGNRTGQWFWQMISSLGLQGMHDRCFDARLAHEITYTFLERKYDRDGKGGLFTIPNCRDDLRREEIWIQMCWFLDSIS